MCAVVTSQLSADDVGSTRGRKRGLRRRAGRCGGLCSPRNVFAVAFRPRIASCSPAATAVPAVTLGWHGGARSTDARVVEDVALGRIPELSLKTASYGGVDVVGVEIDHHDPFPYRAREVSGNEAAHRAKPDD